MKLTLYDKRGIALILLAITAMRLFFLSPYAYVPTLPLFFDEAQYWFWSKHLDVGYYSKPPMIAWLIAGATSVCGDSASCIKAPAVVLNAVTAYIVYLIALRLTGKKPEAFWAALLFITLPAVSMSSAFISTDVPLMLFWALATHAFIHAIHDDGDRWWLLMGVWLGLGMMSKYTMIAFPVSVALYLLFTREHRIELKQPKMWVAFILGFILFSPNLYWNAMHHFISFSHTGDNVVSKAASVYLEDFSEFFLSQFAVFGPILFAALLWSLGRAGKNLKDHNIAQLFWFVAPLLLVALAVSLMAGAQAHWAAPIYVTGVILVVWFALERKRLWIVKVSLMLHALALVTFWHLPLIVRAFDFPDPFARLHTWNGMTHLAVNALRRHPESVLVTDERKGIAMLSYHLRQPDGMPYPVQKWNADGRINDHFDLITQINAYKGYDMVLVTRTEDISPIAAYFSSVQQLESKTFYGQTFASYRLTGFRGY